MTTTKRMDMFAACFMKIKKGIFLAVSVATVAGCAAVFPGTHSTFSDTKNTTPRVYASSLESSIAAKCVIKNIDERLGHMIASLTPEGPRPNVLEVRARSEVGFAAIIEIVPAEKGSLITIWISNHYPAKGLISSRITEGCEVLQVAE